MERRQLKLNIYSLSVGGSSLVFLLALSHYFPFSPLKLPFILLFIPAVIVFCLGVSLPKGEIQEVPFFPLATAAIILYGPAAGAWLVSFSFFLSAIFHPQRRKDLLSKDLAKSLFYLSILLLNMGWLNYSAGMAGLVWVHASHFAPPQECYRHIPALLLLGITYVVIDTFRSSLDGAIWAGASFWKTLLSNRSWNILFAFLEVGLGVLYVLVYYVGGVPLLLLALVFLVVLRWGYLVHIEKAGILNFFMELLYEQLEKMDLSTKRHCEMVGMLAEAVGKEMGVPFWRRDQLVYAARLHDVGKIAVDERIIEGSSPLTPQEREEIRRHTSVPYQAMRDVPYLRQIANWIFLHHEKMDGSGYWGRLGDEIPLEARILGVVDALHALTSPRPYRKEHPFYTLEEAFDLLYEEAEKGKWDVRVLNAMRTILQRNENLRRMLDER